MSTREKAGVKQIKCCEQGSKAYLGAWDGSDRSVRNFLSDQYKVKAEVKLYTLAPKGLLFCFLS